MSAQRGVDASSQQDQQVLEQVPEQVPRRAEAVRRLKRTTRESAVYSIDGRVVDVPHHTLLVFLKTTTPMQLVALMYDDSYALVSLLKELLSDHIRSIANATTGYTAGYFHAPNIGLRYADEPPPVLTHASLRNMALSVFAEAVPRTVRAMRILTSEDSGCSLVVYLDLYNAPTTVFDTRAFNAYRYQAKVLGYHREKKGCENPGCSVPRPRKLYQCEACRTVRYCGRECQVAHFAAHKEMCLKYRPMYRDFVDTHG